MDALPLPPRSCPPDEPTRRETVCLLLRVLEEHTPGSIEKLNRVAYLATVTASRLGLSAAEAEAAELTGRLHDIGLVAVPTEVLRKTTRLSPWEWSIMHTHPEIGERILRSAPSLCHVASLVRWHHERYDGSGYPDHLGGDEIPLAAACVSVAAGFAAMMRSRPWSDGVTLTAALDEIARNSGTQFNPAVAASFLDVFASAVPRAPSVDGDAYPVGGQSTGPGDAP